MRKLIAAGMVALLLAGCSSGSGDSSAGCDEGEAWAEAQGALIVHTNTAADPFEGLDPLIDTRDEAQDQMIEAAPDDVVDAMTEIDLIGPDPGTDAEEERLLDRRLLVEKWLATDCESDVSVEW